MTPAPNSLRPLAPLLGAFLALALAYGAVSPAFEAPDEHAHFYLARHLADGGGLPVQPLEPDLRGPWEQEGSQPPLYYYLAAAAMRLPGVERRTDAPWYNHQTSMGTPAIVGNENRFVHGYGEGRLIASDLWMARLLSTALGAITIVGIWVIAGAAFPGRPLLAVAAAAVAGLNPQFLYLAGSASNDALVVALATLTLAAVTRVADGNAGRWTLVTLAVSAGLAPLAKLSGLAVLGFASVSVAWLAIRSRSPRLLATAVLPALLVAAIAGGWWYVRNLRLYGDVTGLSRMLPGDTRRDFILGKWLAGLSGELAGLWRSFWGLFGWFTIPLPDWVYMAVDVVVVLALAGAVLAAVRRAGFARWGVVGWLALWLGVVFVSLLRWMMMAKGGHGRLLFPALASVAVILIVGLRGIAGPRISDRALALVVGLAMGALGAFSLVAVVRPAYARPQPLTALPASAAAADAVFGPPDATHDVGLSPGAHDVRGGLVLRGVDVPERVGPGRVPVTLYWQLDPPSEGLPEPSPGGPWDGFVALRLDVPPPPRSWGGEVTGSADGISGPSTLAYLGGGALPPALMTPGVLYSDSRVVPDLTGRAVGGGGLDGQPDQSAADDGWQSPEQPHVERLSVHLFHPDRGRWELNSGDVGPAGGDDEWAAWLVRAPSRLQGAPDRDPDGTLVESGAPVDLWADVQDAPGGQVLSLTWRRGPAAGASTGADTGGGSPMASTGVDRQGGSATASTGVDRQGGSATGSTGVDRQDGSATGSTGVDRQGGSVTASTGVDRQDGSVTASTGVDTGDGSVTASTGVDTGDGSATASTGVDRQDGSPTASTGVDRQDGSPIASTGVDRQGGSPMASTGVDTRSESATVVASAGRLLVPGVELSVFVHFLDANGDLIGQADGPPSTAAYFPTWAWGDGDVVTTAPVRVPDGAVSARVGLYEPVSGQRVPATDSAGNTSDALTVALTGAPR